MGTTKNWVYNYFSSKNSAYVTDYYHSNSSLNGSDNYVTRDFQYSSSYVSASSKVGSGIIGYMSGNLSKFSSSWSYSKNYVSNGLFVHQDGVGKYFYTNTSSNYNSNSFSYFSKDYGSYALVFNSNFANAYSSSYNATLVDLFPTTSLDTASYKAYYESYHSHETLSNVYVLVTATSSGSRVISSGYEHRFYSKKPI